MKKLELSSIPGVLSLCYTPAEIALACRLKKAAILAANLGWPAHAITVSREPEVEVPECYREMRNSRPERRPSVTATETFERLEKQHLA